MKKLCSYCHTEAKPYFRSRDYNRRVTQEIFAYYCCPNCGLIFIFPVPEDLGDYYPPTYHFAPETLGILKANAAHERYKIKIIQQYVKQGGLLEIGPSYGCFTYLAKNAGFEAEAIEMDAECSKFLNEVAGILTINSSDVCGALRTVKSYDVIAMWHVIEHLPNPWETLEGICEKLNYNGILVLAAPNPDAFQFHILGRYWPHLDAPRHVMLIPIKLLVEKMEALGMRVELITTTDEGGLGWNIFGWEFFFSNMCADLMVKKMLKIVGRAAARLFSLIEKMEGKGSAYTLVFRKKV
ncbi:MAG: class I SAM-dependent methyltransferase [Desulfobacula sp.]|nr:class I SAM-dependent methyltransferase [Desulfobacula sp.]